jgi:hypothetical protein
MTTVWMRGWGLRFLTLMMIPLTTQAMDPRDCRYWISRLSDVARLEATLLVDIEKVAERDGPYAAQEFRYEVREQLRRLMQQINRENGG